MTPPRPHDELAAQLRHIANTHILSTKEVGALHTAANIFAAMPPIKRTITLTVNGREWVLPEPLKDVPKVNSAYWADTIAGVVEHKWRRDTIDKLYFAGQRVHASESDAKAWAAFDKWCRGGGV